MTIYHSNDLQAPAPFIHTLSNGRYRVTLSVAGGGQSSCRELALNRCGGDPVEDSEGYFIYLRDLDSGAFWSAGYQPVKRPSESYRVECESDACRFSRLEKGIQTELAITLAPEDELEIRRLQIRNRSGRVRRLEVTSYLEVALNYAAADSAHPAFSKLFVQTEFAPAQTALLARRRPRGQQESWPWLVHALSGPGVAQWETDRLRFLGRGRTAARPKALTEPGPLAGGVGNVLDPVFSLRAEVELAPEAEAEWAFLLGMADDRAAALALVERYGAGPAMSLAPTPVQVEPEEPTGGDGLRCFNGYGGFSEDGAEYVIRLPCRQGEPRRPPLPWINVIANERGGCLVSESGAGYAWSRNSQANRLTPWRNDPVSDPHDEAFYIRDESDGRCWSPLPGPAPAAVDYEVRHGFGYSRFRCTVGELEQETTVFTPRNDPIHIVRLRLTQHGAQPRRLSLFCYQRLALGTASRSPSPIVTAYDAGRQLLRAVNPLAGAFADGLVFALAVAAGVTIEAHYYRSGDRRAFIGRNGSVAAPAALRPGVNLTEAFGAGLDPCFAQQIQVNLSPGQTLECAFLLGECQSESELLELVERYRVPGAIQQALEETQNFWRSLLATIQVATPVPALDVMLNGWLVYQNLACRLWGRSAFYQSGGAYGYRDQLQDAAALVYLRPELTRAQIVLHAGHQFIEGDVLHWWHPQPMERGLRTRFSDDLLWLPYVTAYYLEVTGDLGLLDEAVPFMTAPALEPGQDEAYLKPEPAGQSASVYEHCCRALDRSLTRGAHGLPLMGTGDWNDGMNRVGREGKGESVWLGFFLYDILGQFLPLCRQRGDADRAARYAAYREQLAVALNAAGWDGEWYRRAYYDDGTPLGSRDSDECRIDALAQAWAVISKAAPPERAEQALAALERELVFEQDGIIKLLTPPFVDTPHDPGYIKGYVAGVRENGGQYTHAACWAVRAIAELGRNERAARLLTMLSPISRALTPALAERYQVEPYVVAADIYGEPPHVGRGGWTWYTGSAGWLYRVALESVLGLRVEKGDTLILKPCIPADWPGYRIKYRLPDSDAVYEITVENAGGAGRISAVELDGQALPVEDGAARVPLIKDGAVHRVKATLG